MKFVIQRVTAASVVTNGINIGKIKDGLFVLVGIEDLDTYKTADKMVGKLLKLRIFCDENGKINRDICHILKISNDGHMDEIQGEIFIVSQFTLYADVSHGNRPSFIKAGEPESAEDIYKYILKKCRALLNDTSLPDEYENTLKVKSGSFGADMKCEIYNDGPFTIIMDSDEM